MVTAEELTYGIMRFGRGNIQDLVVRTKHMSDAVNYLRVEVGFELARITSFTTVDSVTFQKKGPLKATSHWAAILGDE
jgi:hypothetical protein